MASIWMLESPESAPKTWAVFSNVETKVRLESLSDIP